MFECELCHKDFSWKSTTLMLSGNGKYDVVVCFACKHAYEFEGAYAS